MRFSSVVRRINISELQLAVYSVVIMMCFARMEM